MMVDDPYVKDGRVVIRSSVEMLYGGEDVAYYALSVDEWSKMTKQGGLDYVLEDMADVICLRPWWARAWERTRRMFHRLPWSI